MTPAPEHPRGRPCTQVREQKAGWGRASGALQSTVRRALGFLLLSLIPGTHEQPGWAPAGGSGCDSSLEGTPESSVAVRLESHWL